MDPTPTHRPRDLHPVGLRGPAIAAGAALAFYFLSVDSSPFWGDSASFASHLDTSPKPFARSYWLYKSLGRLLVFLGLAPALAANLASAIFGAAAVGTLWAVVQRLTGKHFAATGAAATLAVAHTFWFHSSVAEVYSLHALFELLLLYFALGASRRPRDAMALGFVAGLALNHHRLIYFSLAALLPFLALELRGSRDRRAVWGRLALGMSLGALPWLFLCLRFPPSSLEPPAGVTAVQLWLQKTFFGGLWSAQRLRDFDGSGLLGSLSYGLRFALLNFPSPAALLALLGLSRLRQEQGLPRAVLLGGSLASCCLAGLLFGWTGDQYAFFSPVLPLVALLAGLGLACWSPRSPALPRAALALVIAGPPLLYAWLAFGGSTASLDREGSLDRQEFLWPARAGYQLPERWCRTRLDELPQGATLVAQWAEGTVFEYLQEQGRRPDLHIQLHRSGPLVLDEGAGPIYVSWKPTRKEAPLALRELGLQLEGTQPGIRRLRR